MFQYFVGKIFGDLPADFSFVIGKKLEYNIKLGYYEIYEGINKNNEEVNIFIYDKKGKERNAIRRYTSNNLNYSKKLIHPNILKVLYTYENDKRIYIVTEKCIPLVFEKIKSNPIWGLYEIINAAHFINTSNYIHCLINPFSIYVNSNGRWKLSLFDCIHNKNSNINNVLSDIRDHLFCEYGYKIKFPNHIHSTYIDAYGLSLLIIWSYKNYSSSTMCFDEPFHSYGNNNDTNSGTINLSNNKPLYKKNENESFLDGIKNQQEFHMGSNIFNIDMKNGKQYIPPNLYMIYDVLNNYSKQEINLDLILNNEHLKNNTIVNTMLFLIELHMKPKFEKTNFLDKLFHNLDNMPLDVKFQMILPELVQNIEISENVNKCLKIILHISKDISIEEFHKHIYPTFVKYFSLTDRSIRYVILEHFYLIEKHLSSNHMNEIYNAYTYGFLDNNMSIKNESIKNFIYVFPKLKKNLKSLSINVLLENLKEDDNCIKTNTIICIAKISKDIVTDKQQILENVYKIGLQDFFVQTRIATLQSIKFTYDQFSARRYVSNIVPLLVSSLIDDNIEVRTYAFDTMEHALDQLKTELLRDSSRDDNNSVDSIKAYKFMDKIKDIIKNKCENSMEVSSATRNKLTEVSRNNEGYINKNQWSNLSMNNSPIDAGSNYPTTNKNNSEQNRHVTNNYINGNVIKPLTDYKNDNSSSFPFENLFSNNVKNNFVYQKNIINDHSYKHDKLENSTSYHNNNNGCSSSIKNSSNNNNDLINMNITQYNEQKAYNNFKSSVGLTTTDKKLKKKTDIDIDEFFDEFDLKKETNNPKIKLSSLL